LETSTVLDAPRRSGKERKKQEKEKEKEKVSCNGKVRDALAR
jgi:hypothetical protein